MDFLLYITERCNMRCKYCDSPKEATGPDFKDITYDFSKLKKFLSGFDKFRLEFYGGEPLLNIPYMEKLVKEIKCHQFILQTNGLLIDKLSDRLLHKIDRISISIDGPRDITDANRANGCYDKVIGAVRNVRERGFKGHVIARMTENPGVDIYNAVTHIMRECGDAFSACYWQLNVMFFNEDWKAENARIRRWVDESYNPGITRLVKEWLHTAETEHKVLPIIPFIGLAHSILLGRKAEWVRCGAGRKMFAITTDGTLYPCPVLREYTGYDLGNIDKEDVNLSKSAELLGEPCVSCGSFSICGGRCLCSNVENPWGAEGYETVCVTVKHLIAEIQKTIPAFRKLIDQGAISLDDFNEDVYDGFEIIP